MPERVTGVDATGNSTVKQVIGNKQDAAATDIGSTSSIVAYLKGILNAVRGAAGLTTFPSAAVPANGVSVAEVLRDIWGSLCGTAAGENGVQTFPAAAAPGNNVSIAEVLRAVYNGVAPVVALGTADIDDSVQDESAGRVALLTITPASGAPLRNVKVVLDLAKATTGFAAVESTATIQFHIGRKVDGTNWRSGQAILAAALSGTNAAGRSVEIDIGAIGVTEEARVEFIMSADATSDMEIPYAVIYEGLSAPTITPVAAG